MSSQTVPSYQNTDCPEWKYSNSLKLCPHTSQGPPGVTSPSAQRSSSWRALRFYAVGSFLEVVGDGIGLSKALVSRSVEAGTKILVHHAQAHNKMPAMREKKQAHQGLHVAGLHQVIGLVDGTLILVSNPSMDDPTFICRKGYSAINTQVVVDHNGLIINVVAKWPGSTVWANSAVGQDAARGVFGGRVFQPLCFNMCNYPQGVI